MAKPIINLSVKKIQALEIALGVTDLQPIIDKVLDDWAANIVNLHYEKNKGLDRKVDEIIG